MLLLQQQMCLQGHCDLSALDDQPEAQLMIRLMLEHNPQKRPTMAEIVHWPWCWSDQECMRFLVDVANVIKEVRDDFSVPFLCHVEQQEKATAYACKDMSC